MDYTEFVADRAATTYPERKDAQREVLEQADGWSSFFENAVTQRLNNQDNLAIMNTEDATEALRQYLKWCRTSLSTLKDTLFHYNTSRSKELLSYLNFHTMSDAFSQQWFRLITGIEWDQSNARRLNNEAQDYLAIASLDTQKKHEQRSRSGLDGVEIINGILSEHDTAIIALQSVKSNPDLLLVPAPGKFEHGPSHKKNADFLLFDTQKREVVGMQVKTFVSRSRYRMYDPNFVFLVDSTTDLGNVITSKQSAHSTPQVISKPGLIAAHRIAKWPKQMDLARYPWLSQYVHDERALSTMKFYARNLTMGTKDISSVAQQRIGERSIYHLYKATVPELPQSENDDCLVKIMPRVVGEEGLGHVPRPRNFHT